MEIDRNTINDIISGKYSKNEIQVILAQKMYGENIKTVAEKTNIYIKNIYKIIKKLNTKKVVNFTTKKKEVVNSTTPSKKMVVKSTTSQGVVNLTTPSRKKVVNLTTKTKDEEVVNFTTKDDGVVNLTTEKVVNSTTPKEVVNLTTKEEKVVNFTTPQEVVNLTTNTEKLTPQNIFITHLEDEKLREEFKNIMMHIYYIYNIYNNNINNNINNNNINNSINNINRNNNKNNRNNILKFLSLTVYKKYNNSPCFAELNECQKNIAFYYLSFMIALGLHPIYINYKEFFECLNQIHLFGKNANWNDYKIKNFIVRHISKKFENKKYVSLLHIKNYIEKATKAERMKIAEEIKEKLKKLEEKWHVDMSKYFSREAY